MRSGLDPAQARPRMGFPRRAILLGLAATGLAVPAFAQLQVTPDQLVFKSEQPHRPLIAPLYGNPRKAELYVYRVKFPKGFIHAPHFHPDVRTVTVISGTLYFAYGDKIDKAALKAFPAGSFLTEQPGHAHFAWAMDGEVILQVSGFGPTKTTDVEPPAN